MAEGEQPFAGRYVLQNALLCRCSGQLDGAGAEHEGRQKRLEQQEAATSGHDDAQFRHAAASAARTFRQRDAEPSEFRVFHPFVAAEALAVGNAVELAPVLEAVLGRSEIDETVVEELAFLGGKGWHQSSTP